MKHEFVLQKDLHKYPKHFVFIYNHFSFCLLTTHSFAKRYVTNIKLLPPTLRTNTMFNILYIHFIHLCLNHPWKLILF